MKAHSEIIYLFITYCAHKGLSKNSLRAYATDINHFVSWLGDEFCLVDVAQEHIKTWVNRLHSQCLAPSTIKRKLACLKVFTGWLEKEGHLVTNPFHRLQLKVKLPRRLPRNLINRELKNLLRTPAQNITLTFAKQTLRVAIELMYFTGIRVGEVTSIKLADIDTNSGTILIHGKGNRERQVFVVAPNCIELINEYKDERYRRSPKSNIFLITSTGTSASTDYIRRHLHNLTNELHLERKITPPPLAAT